MLGVGMFVVTVSRKPIEKTIVANVMEYGTSGLNLSDSRIGSQKGTKVGFDLPVETGRYPTNFILVHAVTCKLDNVLEDTYNCDSDRCPVLNLEKQAGIRTTGKAIVKRQSCAGTKRRCYGTESRPAGSPSIAYGGIGYATRFFKLIHPIISNQTGSAE